ncbi:MAG: protein kinase [Vicinamibacteria bacterium]
MSQPTCPACGAPFDGAGTLGLCPACLLRGALQPSATAEPEHPLAGVLRSAIGDQYEIQRLLGKGAMGAVFLAREKALDRQVAIKVLPPEGSGDGERERFRREARIAARLTHPNVVPLHSFGEAGGLLYFVMGYVRGESLASRMRRGLSLASARRILAELADALDHAHRQGVVHRDVKPDNVLVDDDSGRAMLTDFGIARRDSHAGLTSMGSVIGTPHYMSPEQAGGRSAVDGRSDIYSLGVLGYAMLAGRLPFDGPTVGEILVQHVTREPAPLRRVAPAVPEALAAVVSRCLAKDPRDRWPDARALRDALVASDASDQLPEPLREIEGDGLVFLLTLGVAASFESVQWLWLSRLREIPPQGLPLAVVALVGALTLVRRGLPVRRAGFGWRRIAWAAFLEPSWWPFWYPRGLRRPEHDGVWERLPWRLRAQRWIRLATPVAGLLGLLLVLMSASPRFHEFRDWPAIQALWGWPPPRGGVRPFPPIGMLLGALGWTLVHVAGDVLALLNGRWLARFGLPESDRRAILYAPLSRRSLWTRDAIAAVLRPSGAGEPAPARTPAEMAQRIAAAAVAFTGRDAAVAQEAAAAARHLLASIQEADAEVERISRDFDPLERDRVRNRLDALGIQLGGEPEERRRMRTLFEQQLALLAELEQRLAQASDRRQRRVELLKSLWLEVANLKAAATVAVESQTSARVQALCARISAIHGAPTVALDDDSPTLAR